MNIRLSGWRQGGQIERWSAFRSVGASHVRAIGNDERTAATIQQPKENQQDRIAQGIKSGQLTPGETAKTRKTTTGHQPRNGGNAGSEWRQADAADKKAVNPQQNQASRNIYNKKDNQRRQ